jgi:hypothetical protein
MTEDKFESFLKKTAQSYNTPPARVPRDEMWAAIEAKRAAGPRVVYGGGATYVVSQRRFGTKVWLGAAAAAMLLVATGVGIGRWTASPGAQSGVSTSAVNGAASEAQTPAVPDVNPVGVPEANPAGASGGASGTVGRQPGTASRNLRAVAAANPDASRSIVGGSNPASAASTGSPTNGSRADQLVAVQHLSEAEALLTSFRTRSNTDQQMDAQLGKWARQLLSNTRLLLDSPIADDPQRRPLLEDLELVLVQIVQLSPGSTPQDRDLIEKTLQQDHVMTRLRTAIPAGAQRGS